MCTHTQSSRAEEALGREGGVWREEYTRIALTGGTLLDLWMRQKSHYELSWLADRSLLAAELQTKAAGRS